MSHSLSDILLNRNFDEPPEATAIKQYVLEKYNKTVVVKVGERDITITSQGAAFTNALRMQWRALQEAAQTEKRLAFRIG